MFAEEIIIIIIMIEGGESGGSVGLSIGVVWKYVPLLLSMFRVIEWTRFSATR